MARVSVVICCANAEDTLPAACESVGWADELVIVDSGSNDRTEAIARQNADRYEQEPWRGYTGQKRYGASLARNDWVLILDGDEEVSSGLAEQIGALEEQELASLDVLEMPRRNWVMGRAVRAWWPDWQSRLIHRERAVWPEETLHDARHPSDPARTRRLTGHLEHKRTSRAGFSDYFGGQRMDARLQGLARQMHERGKRAHWWDLLLRPCIAFWKFYLFKRGYRDGLFGVLIAQKAAVSVQLKYAALWALEHPPKPNVEPDPGETTP